MNTQHHIERVELGPLHPDLFDGETPIVMVTETGLRGPNKQGAPELLGAAPKSATSAQGDKS